MDQFEKLGVFYLGRPYDLKGGKPLEGFFLYDSKDLVTHGICVGMTGSGKTGLCISLLEEAAIDGIPAIIIDPKGDMANLLLAFPDLAAGDFLPWVNEDDARAKGQSVEEYARGQADLWQKGLSDWGLSGERIRAMRQNAEFALYTPGSNAGIPVSIVKSFAVPPAAVLADEEILQDQVSGTSASLLGLIGLEADPIRSREHILLATIILHSWKNGNDIDLARLIQLIQDPPVRQIGVMDLESFFPARDRFALAVQFNNLLASPGFAAWLEGEALDIGRILHSPAGKPRLSIFSIAHLDEPERMFFVSLLLNQILSWIRTQSGTSSLRAILYMDEIFGFFPPVANPPSKLPLLTLLKQARAYGLGIMLTTQNPVDLDYKGLANTGTWFVGRLQTERDKMRVLEGLEGAAATQGAAFDRGEMEQALAGLGNRIFLVRNVHDDQPVVFQTRWCLSYLRGPLTRSQIRQLNAGRNAAAENLSAETGAAPFAVQQDRAVAGPSTRPAAAMGAAPALPPDIRQYYLPPHGAASADDLIYRPAAFGFAQIGFRDKNSGFKSSRDLMAAATITDDVFPVDWEKSQKMAIDINDLAPAGQIGAQYETVPPAALESKNYPLWSREFAAWICQSQQLELYQSPIAKIVSEPGETERDFRIRLQQSTREARDLEIEKLKKKYAAKIAALQEKIRKSEQAAVREKEQASQQKTQTAISIGAAILGSFLGRKVISASTLGRATTVIRGAGRSLKEKSDVERSLETVAAYKAQLQELQQACQNEIDHLAAMMDPTSQELVRLVLQPAKTDVLVKMLILLWLPCRRLPDGSAVPAWE